MGFTLPQRAGVDLPTQMEAVLDLSMLQTATCRS